MSPDADEDLTMDGWTELSKRIRAKIAELPPEVNTAPTLGTVHHFANTITAPCSAGSYGGENDRGGCEDFNHCTVTVPSLHHHCPLLEAYEDSDHEKMTQIRQRVDELVQDKNTAQNLKVTANAPSRWHHCTITVPSLCCHCTGVVPSAVQASMLP